MTDRDALLRARDALAPFAKMMEEIAQITSGATGAAADPKNWAKSCEWSHLLGAGAALMAVDSAIATPAPAAGDGRGPTDDELRKLWRAAGGGFHGPHIEHGYMVEEKLLPFLRSIIAATPTPAPSPALSPSDPAVLRESLRILGPSHDGCVERDLAAAEARMAAPSPAEPDGGEAWRCANCGIMEPPVFNKEHDNFYCTNCDRGAGQAYYEAHKSTPPAAAPSPAEREGPAESAAQTIPYNPAWTHGEIGDDERDMMERNGWRMRPDGSYFKPGS